MRYRRLPIEIESPEELGYSKIANNLSESSFSDRRLADYGIDGRVDDLLLQYGDHLGSPRLRELAAADAGVEPGDVVATAGAAAALFIVATSLLGEGGHAVIAAPNYATNLETPQALGIARVTTVDLRFEESWHLDPARIEAALGPDTRLVSLTYPHNPSGAMVAADDLKRIVAAVEAHPTARLLVDETYRDLAYGNPLPAAASLSERAISITSLSKTYGLPGLRIGLLAARDPLLRETFLAAKEQVLICGSTIDEEMAARVLEAKPRILPAIREKVASHLAIVREWMVRQGDFEWIEPQAGVVGLPRFVGELGIDVDRFYESLLAEHGTYVGPGHWFGLDRRSFRLGFAWPEEDELRRGLAGLTAAADAARL